MSRGRLLVIRSHCVQWMAVGIAVSACGQRAYELPDLDLGGGISMTSDGHTKGATAPWPSSLPLDEDYSTPVITAGIAVGSADVKKEVSK